jgi:hypothetical protein
MSSSWVDGEASATAIGRPGVAVRPIRSQPRPRGERTGVSPAPRKKRSLRCSTRSSCSSPPRRSLGGAPGRLGTGGSMGPASRSADRGAGDLRQGAKSARVAPALRAGSDRDFRGEGGHAPGAGPRILPPRAILPAGTPRASTWERCRTRTTRRSRPQCETICRRTPRTSSARRSIMRSSGTAATRYGRFASRGPRSSGATRRSTGPGSRGSTRVGGDEGGRPGRGRSAAVRRTWRPPQ